ncbi:MAG TPA: matrixin family metalloprotease [Thermoanaerobaculia bacterium]|nr:matrixin family metalloprotease [Thermoanaerobaculia bacterium]
MRHALSAVAVLCLALGTLSAATFEPVSDATLVARAELIVRAHVLDTASRVTAEGVIVTDYRLAVEDVLKGRAGSELVVTEIGGSADGLRMIIPGSAEYLPGTRVLAFLRQRPDGTWFTSHMALGHFRFSRGADGLDRVARVDSGLEVDDADAFRPRSAEAFSAFVRETARGNDAAPVAPLAKSAPNDRFEPRSELHASEYVFKGGSPQLPIRWEGCEDGCSIPFTVSGGAQAGVPDTVGGIEDAMAAWNNHSQSFVNLSLGGVSGSSNPNDFDNENTIWLNNNTNVVGQCDASLGCGVVWINDGTPTSSNSHVFRGVTFYDVLDADVLIRTTSMSQNFFEAVLAHELGHAMSLKHGPSGSLMASNIPSNSTATLKAYDQEAMAEVYGAGAPCTPPAITGTSGGGSVPFNSSRQLEVTINASTTLPVTYQWYRGLTGDISNPVGTNNNKYTIPNVTGTMHHWVRVTSQCGTNVAVSSDTITVTAEACNEPEITQQPAGSRVTPGSTATLHVDASGTSTLTVKWFEAASNLDETKEVGSGFTFTTPPLNEQKSYWAKVSNACGIARSNVATITVGDVCVPATIVSQPSNISIPLGSGTTLDVTPAGDAPFTYQWFTGDSPNETQPIPGATNSALALPEFTASGTYKYWVRVSNGCGQTPARSATITVTVLCGSLATPEISAPPIGHVSAGYDVSWTGDLGGTSSFELQEATNAAFTANLRTFTITGELTKHIDAHTEITDDTRFYYRVRAFSSCTQQSTLFSTTASTVITKPLPPDSTEFSISVPESADQPFTQDYLVPGFGETATINDTFSISIDQPWLTVFPQNGALSAGGTTVQFSIAPGGLEVGTTTATIVVSRTQPSGVRGGVTTHGTSSTSLPFSISKVTPVTPTPRSQTPPPGTLIIPAVAHADGIGARFQSDVRIANTSNTPLTYELSFTPSGANGTVTGKMTLLTVAAGESKGLDDIVKAWYGAGVLGEGGLGTLEIRPTTTNPQFSTYASSRTYAVTPRGTLGQYIPALGLDKFVGDINQDSLGKISLQQIANSEKYRTNLGFVEGSGQTAQFRVRLLDANNNVLKEIDRTIQPYGHEQAGLSAYFGNVQVDDGRVEMFVLTPGGKVTTYASVVDNKTTDPLLVFPTQAERSQTKTYVVPGVAELENGASNFHTDMRIFNASQQAVTVSLNYYAQGNPTAVPATETITIEGGHVKALDNILPSLWNLTATGGAVTVTADRDASLVLTARTYSRDPEGGTYGQFIPGVTSADAVGVNDSRAIELLQLEDTPQYRTNIGFVEVTGKPVLVEVRAESPQSKVSHVVHVQLRANEFIQQRLFPAMGFSNNVYNGRVTIRAIGGEGKVAAYGSVVDNDTVDPTYVPAQ